METRKIGKARIFGVIAMLSILLTGIGLTAAHKLDSWAKRGLASQNPKKLVFAIDGLSHHAFVAAQKKGLFSGFSNFGRHIAPYPSMTEPSWTEIMGAKKVFGQKGNVGTIEASFVDVDSLEIHDDPRTVFTRYGSPYSFVRAFDYYFSPVLETLMYFPGKEVVATELAEIEKEAEAKLADGPREHAIIYVSAVDATAHTQIDRLYPLLTDISALIDRVRQSYRDRGIAVETWIISDHGNVGLFEEGQKEAYLKEFDLGDVAKAAGLQIVDNGKLTAPNQIAIPILALGSMGNVYFKDLARRRDFAKAAVANPAVELVTWVENAPKGQSAVVILGSNEEEARVYWNKDGYAYVPVNGNPLQIPAELHSTPNRLHFVSDEQMFAATQGTRFPDAPFRLVYNAKKQVTNEPDLIVNLRDEYCFHGNFSQYVHMVRTHGALSAQASFGTVANDSGREVPEYLRSMDILPTIGISEKDAFHESADLFDEKSGVQAIRTGQGNTLSTRIFEFTQDMLFRRLAKILGVTMDYISVNDAKKMAAQAMDTFKSTQDGAQAGMADQLTAAVKQIDTTKVLSHIDELFQLRAVIGDEKDPKAIMASVEKRLFGIPGLEPLSSVIGPDSASASSKIDPAQGEFLRHAVMKLYSSRDVLNEILNLPETETVPDTRAHGFAKAWFETGHDQVLQDPDLLFRDKKLGPTLFDAIYSERKLVHELAPATFPRIYDPDFSKAKALTIVFVPGIYNELFDREIFAKGLRSIQQNLGVRVLYADVDGRCDATTNGQRLLDILKDDTAQRLARGYAEPKYMIFGYSKGAVDATEMLLLDEEFTRTKILGLLSIASPLRGTKIVEAADLPSEITEGLTTKPLAQGCDSHGASQSLLRSTRDNFWAKNLAKLPTLTRLYSVSFVSTMEEAHPWMKICKMIARFNAPNDGVVPLDSSHFPDGVRAVDLGTLSGDHLAGILASSFPQEAFMDSLVISLQQVGAFDSKITERWFRSASQYSPALVADFHRRAMEQQIVSGVLPISGFLGPIPVEADSDNWYLPIFAEQYALDTPISCKPDALKGVMKSLKSKLSNSAYALKPFSLACRPDGSVNVSIDTSTAPFYKFWVKDAQYVASAKTLGELIDLLLSRGLKSGENALEAGGESVPQIPKSDRAAIQLPQNGMKWTEDTVIDLSKSGKTIATVPVDPILPQAMPKGFSVVYDHASVKDFRREYQFSYESRSPGGMDDNPQGYFPWIDTSEGKSEVAMRLRSKNNSIRLSTSAMRFRVSDFPKFKTRFKVLHGPNHPDSRKGGAGRDDSAYEIWFTLRNLKGTTDRTLVSENSDVRLFGYFWADPDEKGQMPKAGEMIENYFSKKNFIIATLPESWEVALGGGPDSENKWQDVERDFAADVKKAYPAEDPENWEVISITIWVATNDTQSDSEAYFKSFSFEPVKP